MSSSVKSKLAMNERVVIVATSAAVKALHLLADRFLLGRLQAWRRR